MDQHCRLYTWKRRDMWMLQNQAIYLDLIRFFEVFQLIVH